MDEEKVITSEEIPIEQKPEALPESEEEILNRIFIGEFDNLPSLASKLVRIFTSSTFTGISIYLNIHLRNAHLK